MKVYMEWTWSSDPLMKSKAIPTSFDLSMNLHKHNYTSGEKSISTYKCIVFFCKNKSKKKYPNFSFKLKKYLER